MSPANVMCGIAGLVGFDRAPARARVDVEAMIERIRHRGPDGGGVIEHEDVTLGMARLAIVDVAHGHQPMSNEDGSIVIVFNGEVYNAPALRAQMTERGVKFLTRSDTEVILRRYEENPDTVEDELAGMWAFAIHDRRRRRVLLSRDRFGIKPLFVADTGRSLAFASELKSFDRGMPELARAFEVDPAAAHGMITFSFVPETATIFRGVRRLAPGTRLEIDVATGARSQRTYWSLRPSREAGALRTLADACDAVESALRRAVREHLESDVPIATFLSGGIDSSLVTALAQEESRSPIKAFAIGFQESYYDESGFARETAARLGLPIEVETFTETTARSKVVDAILSYDEPFGDSSSLATYLLCERVGADFKVALGGDGGDEVFAGYKKYKVVQLRRPFRHIPFLRDRIARLAGRLPRLARPVARGLAGSDAEVYAALTQFAPYAQTAPLLQRPVGVETFLADARHRFERAVGTELQRTLAADLDNTLCNDMLVKVDRASMACHLEARVPFLDHRVVELGVGLPERFLLGGGGKRVLRALHERRFGQRLARRRKHGFGVPIEAWLRGPFAPACERLFERGRLERYGVLSPATLSGGAFRAWAERDPKILWHAFTLAAWCEAVLGDGPDALRALVHGT